MGVVYTQESAYAQEMRKWNAHHSEYGPPGRPFVYQEYPMRMYRFERKPDGSRPMTGETANDETEREQLERRGFVAGGPAKALEAFEAQELEYARLAAEREYDKHHKLSARAAEEATAVEQAAGAKHLPVIPETPIKRKGWPKGKPRAKAADVPQEA